FSKRSDSKITFDGQSLLADGWPPDRDPVIQAKAQSRWLREMLLEETGERYQIHPVILFPGWFIEDTPGAQREVWVLNPKSLTGFLNRRPEQLSRSEIKLAASHLSRYVRAAEASRRD